SSLDQQFAGLAGDDTIIGNDSDFLEIMYHQDDEEAGGTTAIVANLQTGIVQDGFGDTDTVSKVDGIRATRYDDTLTGSDGAHFERFQGLAGNDVIDGGGGAEDEVDHRRDPGAVSVDLSARTATDGYGGTDTLRNIEWVRGSGHNDTIVGDAAANRLRGESGDDQLTGGAGSDSLSGGAGADLLVGGADADLLQGGAGNDTFSGTAADLAGDTIADFAVGDSILVTGADLSSLNGTAAT